MKTDVIQNAKWIAAWQKYLIRRPDCQIAPILIMAAMERQNRDEGKERKEVK